MLIFFGKLLVLFVLLLKIYFFCPLKIYALGKVKETSYSESLKIH